MAVADEVGGQFLSLDRVVQRLVTAPHFYALHIDEDVSQAGDYAQHDQEEPTQKGPYGVLRPVEPGQVMEPDHQRQEYRPRSPGKQPPPTVETGLQASLKQVAHHPDEPGHQTDLISK